MLKTGERRKLVQGANMCRFIAIGNAGYLVYRQANSLIAAPFDPLKVKITGPGLTVQEGVRPQQFNISASGELAYVPGGDAAEQVLMMFDRKGVARPISPSARNFLELRISPDGSRLALTMGEDQTDIWLYDLQRETLSRLTYEGAQGPVWSPDGKHIAYVSRRNGTRRLFERAADGSGSEQEIMKGEIDPFSWSPDGKFLVYNELSQTSRSTDIWTYSLENKKAEPFLQTPVREVGGYFSPDGRFLAYSSEESGQSEVYVQAFPAGGGKWQISSDGGGGPRWNPNGKELFYANDNKVMSVQVKSTPTFSAGKPAELFEADFSEYAVAADGQHFIMLSEKKTETSTMQINLVLNLFDELKRRLPSVQK
jgi:dipeptidyl aminopeptidase/acylaminoacyl peptidase